MAFDFRYVTLGAATTTNAILLAQTANSIYSKGDFDGPIKIRLTKQYTMTTATLLTSSPTSVEPETLLEAFCDWKTTAGISSDVAYLLSSRSFVAPSAVRGIAK
jgi:hypothetical protein